MRLKSASRARVGTVTMESSNRTSDSVIGSEQVSHASVDSPQNTYVERIQELIDDILTMLTYARSRGIAIPDELAELIDTLLKRPVQDWLEDYPPPEGDAKEPRRDTPAYKVTRAPSPPPPAREE